MLIKKVVCSQGYCTNSLLLLKMFPVISWKLVFFPFCFPALLLYQIFLSPCLTAIQPLIVSVIILIYSLKIHAPFPPLHSPPSWPQLIARLVDLKKFPLSEAQLPQLLPYTILFEPVVREHICLPLFSLISI